MNKLSPLAALIAAAVITSAVAEDAASDKLWSGEVTLNYSENSGNTESSLFSGKSKAVRDGDTWRNTFKLEGDNETAQDFDGIETRTAEKYFASAKADYKVTQKSFLFVLLEHTDDRFSGYDYETSITLGYGRQLIDTPAHNLKADIGPGYRRSVVEDTDDVQEDGLVRIGAQYVWTINENATFDEDVSAEVGDDKTVTKSLTRLKVKINGNLWGSISYEIKHTDEVPPGIKNSDRKTLLGLNYVF